MRKKRSSVFPKLYLGIILALTYVPIIIVVIFSFNASKLTTSWGGWSLSWYSKLFNNASLFDALKNSLILALLSSSAAGVIGTAGAVGLARAKSKVHSAVEYVSTLPIMIPEIILGMVFMVFFSLLGLKFGMLTLFLGHTSFCIPYVYMIVKARLVGLDKSLPEAARDLGATGFRAFRDITLPLITPGILSGMLLAFAMSLDDVVISIFVTGARTVTLPVKIYTQIKTGITPEINALCTLMLIVTFLLVMLSSLIGKKRNQ